MKLVPQGSVITLIRGVPDEMGKEQGLGGILLSRAQRQEGRTRGRGKANSEGLFLELPGGPLSRLVSEDKCQCLDLGITLSGDN